MRYWLFKSEPNTFSIDDLSKRPQQTEPWDGVRNYQVRNLLRDVIAVGDMGFFYHSSCAVPGIVGTISVASTAYPDAKQWQPNSPYYDPKATREQPRWYCVDVQLRQKFATIVSLQQIKQQPALRSMIILRKGNRLSITPVSKAEWQAVLKLAGAA